MTTAKTRSSLAREWPTLDRGDGRVEILCPHGVGHTSKTLSEIAHHGQWRAWMSTHGCDGCCGLAVYYIAEMIHAGKIQ